MNRDNTLLRGLLAIALLLGGSQAASAAAVLSLLPGAQDAAPPQFVDLDLVISGLGEHTAPSLGAFDIDFSFDSSKLTFAGYTLGGFLGTAGTDETDNLSLGAVGDSINLAELSYLAPSSLALLQPSGFSLATLRFQVVGLSSREQTWVRFFKVNVVSDGSGDPLDLAATNDAVIPAPPVVLLCGLGLLLLIRNRGRGSIAQLKKA